MAEFSKIEELEELVEKDASNFQARRELSVALLDKGFNEDALKHINYLINIFPDDARLYFNQGIVFEKLKKDFLAEKSYKKAIELDRTQTDFLYNLGYLFLQNNKYDEALELFWEVLEKDSKDANVFFNIGFLLSKKGEHKQAIEYLAKAYEINNSDTLALFYIAYEYSRLKDYEQAKVYYNKVLDQCPDYSWAYFNLASIAYNEGKRQEAFNLVQSTLDYNPKDIEAYKFGAKILVEAKNLENAQLFIEQGLEACENDGNLYYILGQINKLQRNYRGYVENLKLAIKNHMTLTMNPKKIRNELTQFIEKQRK